MSALSEAAWLGESATPPAAPNRGGRPAKDHKGRQRKVYCERCGFIAYASCGALQRSGLPRCGCGEPLTLANLRDRAAVEWDALAAELESYGRDAYNAAMRELGFADMIERQVSPSLGGAEQKRCQWEGGYCAKFASGRYCPEHKHDQPEMGATHRRAA